MGHKIKILWLCNYSLSSLNHRLNLDINFSTKHPVTWLYYLSGELAKNDQVELHIITLSNYIDKDYHIIENNIHFHIMCEKPSVLPTIGYKVISKLGIIKNHRLWKQKVLSLVEHINPDIINIHGTEGNLQTISNELDFPMVIWMQGLMNRVIKTQSNDTYEKWLESENKLLKDQSVFISFPGDMEKFIRSKNNFATIYNLYHPLPDSAFDLYTEEVEKVNDLVFVGELVRRKGIEDFINLVARLKYKQNNIKAVIIGFTGNKEYLRSLEILIKNLDVESNIRFSGYLADHKDVLMEIKKSKLFILPTYVDTGPRSVAESMTVGTPVISYDIDGLPEMIKSDYNGILVPVGNIDELLSRTNELLNNTEKVLELRKNAFNLAREKYLSENVVNNLLKIYLFTIAQSNNGRTSAAIQ